RCRHSGGVGGDRWVLAENPKTGQAVVMACRGVEMGAGANIFGRDGYFLQAEAGRVHEAKQTQESVFFISYLPADRARDLGEALAELKELP
ncbi:MAG: hypothetical protein OEV33_02325, partial [Armatimonadota bacterium]|nr:hypothetical protein [Armatimonadota bacterium]